MEASTGKLMLVVLVASLAVTEGMNYLALPRMGRSGYIAFPRLGRGYIAFPRLGRSKTGTDADKDGAECCMTGLKMEWVPQESGTTAPQNVCSADSCCVGLREILAQKPDGVFYSMCIPAISQDSKTAETSKNVLQKLKEMLQN